MSPSALREESLDVIDIRGEEIQIPLLDEINRGLRPESGAGKHLPTMLLYDAKGLALFEDITYLDEYYLTNAEIDVLERHCDQIASRIAHGALVVELGSGNLRKVGILLRALNRAEKDIDYYALDLSLSELYRTLAEVESFEHVRCHGLHGTYDDGLKWMQQTENQNRAKCVMSLGSSIGNFERGDDANFLKDISNVLGPDDLLIVGLDGCQNADKVYHAYNDRYGVTHEFYRNGLRHANKVLGKELFKPCEWDIIGEYDAKNGRHQAFISPHQDMNLDGIKFTKGERIHFEYSHKYSKRQRSQLWSAGGFQLQASFTDKQEEYFIDMMSVSRAHFALKAEEYAKSPVPSLEDFRQLWTVWDIVTLQMIPRKELLSKPINLRNCCLFYLGHIPTFLDMHLTRATGGAPTEPSSYVKMFERGIDPDVENPALVHAHSDIPDEWPPVEEILEFQARVRERTVRLYEDKSADNNAKVGRALWIGLEHEAMHLETLLYMLLQSDKTLPPPGPKPNFEAIAKYAQENPITNEWIRIPERNLTIGMDDPETNEGPRRYFGWDNEKPTRGISVASFEAKARPITNGEYARYMEECNIEKCPESWTTSATAKLHNGNGVSNANGTSRALTQSYLSNKAARTVYGPVPLSIAVDWPVMASYDELAGCANWMNGRIPTLEEARSIYAYASELETAVASNVCAEKIPAVNGHLSNDGVEETPPSHPLHELSSSTNEPSKLDPNTLFVNLSDCNVGFKHFHPTPVTPHGRKLTGLSGMGGVWEWTSSVLETYEGFEPMELYPVYTADFFDGKHNVVLGGSWATHPRIAGRKSFVNWYQRNYPYAWIGARIVRDL